MGSIGMYCGNNDACEARDWPCGDDINVNNNNVVTADRAALQITLVSDTQCPWCYVGKKHLDNAVAVAGVSVQIQYEPFLVQDAHLDRLGYPEGVALIELLTKKYGREEAAQHFDVHHKRLTQAGKRVGIPFRTPWVQTVVRSADSHRLIEYCKAVAPAQTGVLVDAL